VLLWLVQALAGAVRPVSGLRIGAAAGPGLGVVGLVIVLDIHHRRRADLLGIGQTARGARLFAGLGEDGEQDRRQNSDDGDDNQQFDEGETGSFVHDFPPENQ
jgi:hypothetical protein